jgi:hypothetical protein
MEDLFENGQVEVLRKISANFSCGSAGLGAGHGHHVSCTMSIRYLYEL